MFGIIVWLENPSMSKFQPSDWICHTYMKGGALRGSSGTVKSKFHPIQKDGVTVKKLMKYESQFQNQHIQTQLKCAALRTWKPNVLKSLKKTEETKTALLLQTQEGCLADWPTVKYGGVLLMLWVCFTTTDTSTLYKENIIIINGRLT